MTRAKALVMATLLTVRTPGAAFLGMVAVPLPLPEPDPEPEVQVPALPTVRVTPVSFLHWLEGKRVALALNLISAHCLEKETLACTACVVQKTVV